MPPEVEPLIHPCPHCGTLIDVSDEEPFSEVTCPGCEQKVRVRTRFNHFELIEMIASGGMGTVYKARDENLNRVVALKLLRKEFSIDEDYIEKLENEAKITASVNHPHVVKVFSFGSDNGLYYIAMELVDKGSLDDLMSLQGRIAEVQVLEIGIQVAEGLRAAVDAGLIHRDVKPGNILFADAHTAKIVDFGLAMPLEQAQESEEEIWGTPYYVAPEKLNHEPEDFRSDIYSLGGTLFHALAGRPPFEADNASLVALKHIKSQVVSLQAFAPDISSPTSYVINRTLAKDPEDRYQSYDELIEHLTFARTKLLENTARPREPKARVVVEGEEQQTILGYLFMGVIVLVLLLGVLLYVFRDRIALRHMTPAERERVRLLQAAGTVDERYENARHLIAEGEAASALPVLWNLERRPNIGDPLKEWILLHEGLSALLSGMPGQATDAFTRLRKITEAEAFDHDPLMLFFRELSVQLGSRARVPEALRETYATPGYQPIGLLLLGLHEWEMGQYARAVPFFQAFVESRPEGEWEWITRYHGIARKYLDDQALTADLARGMSEAKTPEQRKALLGRLREILPKLQLEGRLTEWVRAQEALLDNGLNPPEKRPPLTSTTALQAQVKRLLHDLQPDQAKKVVEAAYVGPSGEPVRARLLREIAIIADFKEGLIDDINDNGYYGEPLTRKDGQSVRGRFTKAGPKGLEGEGGVSLAWTDLRPASIAAVAASFISSRSGEIPKEDDVPRLWTLGAYQVLSGARANGFPRLMRAAEVKREYAHELSIFDSSIPGR